MVLKVTFDTNVFTRFLKLEDGAKRIFYEKILEAIKRQEIKGYFSDTFITLEGVMRNKKNKYRRKEVFGSRHISSLTSSKSPNTIDITIGASMIKTELDKSHLLTVTSLLNLGLWGLRGPAYMGDNFSVPSNIDLYESICTDELIKIRKIMEQVEVAIGYKNNQDKIEQVEIAIRHNVGKCRARELGLLWLARENIEKELWFKGLNLCRDNSENNHVIAAISEWADAESVIRHIGYGNDYFCTNDCGKNAKATPVSKKGVSIFDNDHRKWLASEFGVKFVTPEELVGVLTRGAHAVSS